MKTRRIWEIAFSRFLCVKKGQTIVLTQYHIKNSYRDEFLEVLERYAFSSLQATGNAMAEAYYERGDSCIMWMIERWSSPDFYKKNKRTTAAKAVGALVKIGMAGPVETFFLQELELFSREISRDALTIMLFVDVKAGTEEHFKSINRNIMPALQKSPGLLLFQLNQVVNHKTQFVIYKKFSNWDTFQYHLKEPALDPVMKFLQTSIKEYPFENGYHHLIQFGQL
ncbi:putative quinol monooxygenase [Chitinophaga sp. CF418]|uniref:putative quinol monooxygenase n=1 Tax=Chitinophaga sp. CF418 TaxID=1855287 RepID=UPI000918AD1F|nr:antibiotic biosynthesis monooxygenase [Chitinophaga sp. CF418]SHN42382.1 Quinol monooxygenase YgiN [Chitinophaga sp. CF418]